MRASVEDIKNRFNNANSGTQSFYSLYKKAYEFCAPNANNVDKGSNVGQLTQLGILDSTMTRSADAFVNTFITTNCPPQTRWMELEPADEIVKKISEEYGFYENDVLESLRKSFQEITKIFFDALNQSNFYSVFDQFSLDSYIGTGVLLVQKANDLFNNASPLDFTAIPPLDLAVEVSKNQKITGVFRKSDVKYSEVKMLWPQFDMSVIKEVPDKQYTCTKTFIEACILEPKTEKTNAGFDRTLRWRYVVIHEDSIGYETYYRDNPFIVFFWSLIQGENVGRGLALKAMPDALQLEAMVDLKNRWVQMYGYGMHSVMPSMLLNPSTTNIKPNSVILVKDQNAIKPVTPAGNPQIQQLEIEKLKQSIKEISLDFTVPNDPNMTATQVNYIAQRQLQIFAGVVGRIQFQLLWPIVQNCINILIESGYVKIPEYLGKIDISTTKMKILSPIGRVQNLNDLNSMMNALTSIAQINPTLIQTHIKVEDLPTWIFNQTGSPADFLRSEKETKEEEQKLQQQQALLAQQG